MRRIMLGVMTVTLMGHLGEFDRRPRHATPKA
jgi:hypothetical protein